MVDACTADLVSRKFEFISKLGGVEDEFLFSVESGEDSRIMSVREEIISFRTD